MNLEQELSRLELYIEALEALREVTGTLPENTPEKLREHVERLRECLQ